MIKQLLPEKIFTYLNNVNFNNVNEVRLRLNTPILFNVKGENYFLTTSGLSLNSENAIYTKQSMIDFVLQKASNNSLYTINDQLINGYVSYGAVRIGVCGELVMVNGKIKTIKNINALNIRIPHFIKNCSLPIYKLLVTDQVKNTLIVSPPGAGKTTFIRDLAYQISNKEKTVNILIADERCEITGILDSEILTNVDVYKNCTKEYAFTCGIRSMKPNVIITDEIDINKDINIIEEAMCSGVKVIATIHANNLLDLKNKKAFNDILNKQLFERFVVLSAENGYGTIEGVYNENMRCIYA